MSARYDELNVRGETGLGAEAGGTAPTVAAGEERRAGRRRLHVSEVVELTRELVRIDTINPPGGEAAAAELVGGRLEAAGFDVSSRTSWRPAAPGWWRGSAATARALCMTGAPRHGAAGARRVEPRAARRRRSTATGCTGAGRAT